MIQRRASIELLGKTLLSAVPLPSILQAAQLRIALAIGILGVVVTQYGGRAALKLVQSYSGIVPVERPFDPLHRYLPLQIVVHYQEHSRQIRLAVGRTETYPDLGGMPMRKSEL